MFDNALFPLIITAILITIMFILFLIVSLNKLKNTQIDKEKKLLQALADEQERIVGRISVEIHDNINQILSHTRMSLNMIRKYAVPEQNRYIAQSGKMLDAAIRDLRNISHSLNSEYLKSRGLIEFLQEEEKWINLSKNIQCSLEVEGKFFPLAPEKELMIIRIIQEAIQNTLKHASAKNLKMRLDYKSKRLKLLIADDGIGFDKILTTTERGFGLRNMYERSRTIDGIFEVRSGSEAGTTVELIVPIKS